jgi:hypothetical protein
MIVYLIAVTAIAVLLRYELGLTDACGTVAKSIGGAGAKPELEDDLTPHSATIFAILAWLISAAVIAAAFLRLGVYFGLIASGVFVVAAIVAGALFIPAPESTHYIRLIHGSVVRRHAAFVESGDRARAKTFAEILNRLQSRYGAVLGK